MAQVRQSKSVSNNNSSIYLVILGVVLVFLLAVIMLIVTQFNSIANTQIQTKTADKSAAIAYCTEKTQRYAKTDSEFRLGVEGCMDYDDYAKSLIVYK